MAERGILSSKCFIRYDGGEFSSFIHSFINANIGSLLTPINSSVAVIIASAETVLILPLCSLTVQRSTARGYCGLQEAVGGRTDDDV